MITLTQFAARLAWPLALALSILLILLVALLLVRRGYRYLYFRRLDEARRECGPVLENLLRGSTRYEEGLDCLRTISHGRPHGCLEALLLADKNPSPERVPTLARLCEDLGLVSEWQRRLANQNFAYGAQSAGSATRRRVFLQRMRPLSFVLRAEAAANLGTIRHRPSWPLLVETLGDSHSSVRSVAAQALGRIQEPRSFAVLVERLEHAAIEPVPKISLRSLKMALTSFPLAVATHLRSMLETPHWRARFLAADIVSGLVQRKAEGPSAENLERDRVPAEIAEIFLARLRVDENPDVRARAADVIGYLEEERTVQALMQLAEDPQWFVRLHTVRALAHRDFVPFAALVGHLTDPHWRVREAAAQALCAQGRPGIDRLVEHFRSTEDRYSQEQVAEQLEQARSCEAQPGRGSEWACYRNCRAILERVHNLEQQPGSARLGT